MSKRPFNANLWFNSPVSPVSRENTSSVSVKNNHDLIAEHKNFSLASFFVPGWRGESIISKQALVIKNIHKQLCNDSKKQFCSFHGLNKSLKLAIYNEFVAFANSKEISCQNLDNFTSLWEHLQSSNSPYKPFLNEFISLYCFRAVTIYMFKIRFMTNLCINLGICPTGNNLLNPTSFLGKIFKSGSSKELICESLQVNQYSWYRPSNTYQDQIVKLSKCIHEISITEMMKICTYNPSTVETENRLHFDDNEYSHSISHRSFGVFVNDLFLKFPKWINQTLDKKDSSAPKILNCKFSGNHLTSFVLSHWLAQEHTMNESWNEIICPDFKDKDFINGQFVKICHELQYLSYLIEISEKQQLDTVELICTAMRDKYSVSPIDNHGQISIFSHTGIKHELQYDRIIINLTTSPKNNPHHHLVNQINQGHQSLKTNGLIYIFTNQQLFVPSHNDRTEQLFKTLKIEANFNFDQLKGKGEIPSFLYVLRKRNNSNPDSGTTDFILNNNFTSNVKKESCLTFKVEGQLSCFSKFSSFVNELEHFFNSKNAISTPIYRKEISEELIFEFHQDAVVNGKLINSMSDGPSGITHPNFFKNLAKSCIPLEYFFYIESLESNTCNLKQLDNFTSNLLGINRSRVNFPIVLVVNQTDPLNIGLELISADSYKAKFEKYGHAYFQYFGLSPKLPNLNINIFRIFFETSIGHQLTQLSLNGATTKLKSKLKALLIPKFFSLTSKMPEHMENSLTLLKSSSDQLLSLHPSELSESFHALESSILPFAKNHPWHTISFLAYFKFNLEKIIQNLQNSGHSISEVVNFNNPLIIEKLLKLETFDLLPNNPNAYLEFKNISPSEIHLPLTNSIIKNENGNNILELASNDKTIVKIYSGRNMLSFIEYVLSSANDVPISTILQGMKIPKQEDLEKIIENFKQTDECFENLTSSTVKIISQILTEQIMRT